MYSIDLQSYVKLKNNALPASDLAWTEWWMLLVVLVPLCVPHCVGWWFWNMESWLGWPWQALEPISRENTKNKVIQTRISNSVRHNVTFEMIKSNYYIFFFLMIYNFSFNKYYLHSYSDHLQLFIYTCFEWEHLDFTHKTLSGSLFRFIFIFNSPSSF